MKIPPLFFRTSWLLTGTCALASLAAPALYANTLSQVTQHGITWQFDREHQVGQFVNGDYWVVGPVTIISISNEWNSRHGFTPNPGQSGSMVDPDGSGKQGYDDTLRSYDASLNAALPRGRPLSRSNPLKLAPGSSLVSAVSWLYNSESDGEPGIPRFNGGTRTPRPVIRDAAILTVLSSAPPEGSFRPPYAGKGKEVKFNVSQLQRDLLKNLRPVRHVPDPVQVEKNLQKPWIDHVHEYLGAFIHPSEHMPNYGRDMSIQIGEASLMLHLDYSRLPGRPTKDKLLVNMVQLGIDFAGIADAGGGWPANGGHHMGRKWPILFAGLMLNDAHMKNVGHWETIFQENQNTFYVSQKEVNVTSGGGWSPDRRATPLPYKREHIGLPEWGIRHAFRPEANNLSWDATYRQINNQAFAGWTLAIHIMGQREAWNHDALLDYTDRAVANGADGRTEGTEAYEQLTFGNRFIGEMWRTYRKDYGPVWTPDNKSDLYSQGKRR